MHIIILYHITSYYSISYYTLHTSHVLSLDEGARAPLTTGAEKTKVRDGSRRIRSRVLGSGESGWDATVGLAAVTSPFSSPSLATIGRRRAAAAGLSASHHTKMQNFKLRVSNPRAVAYSHIKVPSEGSNIPGAGPISFEIEQHITNNNNTFNISN